MHLPTLTTSRLRLRPAAAGDAASLQELWSHAEVRRFLFDDQPVNIELAVTVLADRLALAERGLGLWIIELLKPARQIGCAGLGPTTVAAEHERQLAGLVELLVALHPHHWDNGYAIEAMRAVLRYAFTELSLPTVAAVNDVPNVASARMLQRLGFQPLSQVPGPRYALQTYKLSAPPPGSSDDA